MSASTLRESINEVVAEREAIEKASPGFFWADRNGAADNGRNLSREEAVVFGIEYAEFLRMITVREAWLCFIGVYDHDLFHDGALMLRERELRPDIPRMDWLNHFHQFATEIGGLTSRQSDAIYFKDFFWGVRNGARRYKGEDRAKPMRKGKKRSGVS
jgi:hypothetical protein